MIKFPGTNLLHFEDYQKDGGWKWGFQTFGIYFIKIIVIVVILRICIIPNKLKMTILMTVYRIESS